MDAEQFRQRAELDQTLPDYLDDVAQKADPDQAAHRAAAMTLLFGVAAYALYRLAKNYFDHKRGLQEAELRKLMEEEVEVLAQKGWSRDKALEVVQKVSKEVASLRPDSPVLKAALALLGNGADSPTGG
jgi:hypothetical protein